VLRKWLKSLILLRKAFSGGERVNKIICIVAFSDLEGNSIAYRKFGNVESAVSFYREQLLKEEVNVISTRKTVPVSEKEGKKQ